MDPAVGLFARLITAYHILHKYGVLCESGSLSVRNPADPSTYFSSTVPAILISTAEHISRWNVRDGTVAVQGFGRATSTPPSASEPYIHSCIYDRFPGVRAIVHSQSNEFIVFGLCDAGGSMLSPVSRKAGFIGDYAPIFDPIRHRHRFMATGSNSISDSHGHSLAIDTKNMGDAVAQRLDSSGEPVRANGDRNLPVNTVTMLRGNGLVLWAQSLEEAVYRAIHAQRNAEIQTAAMLQRSHSNLEIVYMTPEETLDTSHAVLQPAIEGAWAAWSTETYRTGFYRNNLLATTAN